MAIYHFSGMVISRSQGRSAVAASAYRSGERLLDERQERIHDYSQKEDIAHAEILLPENAPTWMKDRQQLWNAVESHEKRKDAQLAREFTISLPRELTLSQNIELAREFVQREFVDKGMVADLCIHNDRMPNGDMQPHAHVMLTMREVTPNGFGQKVREWNAKENLTHWREEWANTTNRHLSLQGHDIQIDHRSFKDQGIELEPQYKIGTAVAFDKMARLADHQRIARENGERIYADPNVALYTLTRQQSTFTHHDLARFINRHTLDAEQFQRVYDKVKSSPEMVHIGFDAQNRERFTTREMLKIENRMVQNADTLHQHQAYGVSEAIQQDVLNRYGSLSEAQKIAFEYLTSTGHLKCVVGFAGTGKSYMLGAAREAWETQGYRVHGVTLSGIAAENLEASSGIQSRTLASREYYWHKGEQALTHKDILVVDEAGMLGSRQMERVISHAEQAGAKIILVGDPQQLQAIEAGAAFRAIAQRYPYVELTDIRRQHETWQKEASKELALGHVEKALNRYQRHDNLHHFTTKEEAREQLVQVWNDARNSHPEKTQIMLAFTRKEVQELNEQARALRRENSELGQDHLVQTERGQRQLAENDRIYFLQNNKELGVKNGTLGTIEKIDGKRLQVKLDKGDLDASRTIHVNLEQYKHLDHGYAATFHKSQGVTVDRSYILATRHMDSHTTYVGVTRHRESCDIFYSQDEFRNKLDLAQQLGRDRAKDTTLDYTHTFSEQRDFNPTEQRSRLAQEIQAYREAKVHYPTREQETQEHPTATRTHAHDLAHFRKQFEAKNPELAKSIQQDMQREPSALDKRLVDAERQMKQLEHQLEKSGGSRVARDNLQKFATSLAKDKEVMQHIKQQNPDLGQKLEKLHIQHQRTIARDRGIER